jgi:MFS family permease
LGRKRVLILAAVAFFASALGTALPRNLTEFIVFRILGGVGIGAASITSPMYIAEITPFRVRGRMVSVNQFAIVSGISVVYFVNYFIAGYGTAQDKQAVQQYVAQHGAAVRPEAVRTFLQKNFVPQYVAYRVDEHEQQDAGERIPRSALKAQAERHAARRIEEFLAEKRGGLDSGAVADFAAAETDRNVAVDPIAVNLADQGALSWNAERGWRWMFGSGVFPSVLFLGLLFFVPESPRWLTRQNRRDEALAILTRVDGPEYAKQELRMIEETIAQESGSLAQLFEPGMRIVLFIGIALAILQQVTGINVFLYFAPKIFKSLGSGMDAALLETVVVGAVNVTFTVIAISVVDRLGRKPLMLLGAAGMGLSLLAVGLAAYLKSVGMWVLVFILGYIACFAMSVGPVTWVILSEIFPTHIRGRAMGIATICLWSANFVVSQTFPMMNESEWLIDQFHRAFPFWVYAVFCVVLVLVVWRFVPETKGKSLDEIERSWAR